MATQPSLAGVTLPHPSGYTETWDYRASSHLMADGDVEFQYISTTHKRVFVLSWQNITTANKAIVESAIQAIINDADGQVAYTAPDGETSITVTRDPAATGMVFTAVSASGTLYWSGSISLREV